MSGGLAAESILVAFPLSYSNHLRKKEKFQLHKQNYMRMGTNVMTSTPHLHPAHPTREGHRPYRLLLEGSVGLVCGYDEDKPKMKRLDRQMMTLKRDNSPQRDRDTFLPCARC